MFHTGKKVNVLLESDSPFIFAISGYKNSGKTTLITKLIPLLTKKGYQVAVIKHDGHDFVGDEPGTDSYRHQQAGAYGTAVFSAGHFMVNKRCASVTEKELIALFPEADIILVEGLKDSDYPKFFCDYPNKILSDKDVESLADHILNQLIQSLTQDSCDLSHERNAQTLSSL